MDDPNQTDIAEVRMVSIIHFSSCRWKYLLCWAFLFLGNLVYVDLPLEVPEDSDTQELE